MPRQKRLPETLSDDQVRQLLAGIYSPIHRTCLALMYACGLRISEATKLEISAIDRANKVLRIVGKGNKERLVPLPQPALDALGLLWRRHRNRRWIFPNQCGDGPLNQRVLSNSFADAAAAIGLRRVVTPHTLRHSYATRLIENDVNIRIVQILLGHADVEKPVRMRVTERQDIGVFPEIGGQSHNLRTGRRRPRPHRVHSVRDHLWRVRHPPRL